MTEILIVDNPVEKPHYEQQLGNFTLVFCHEPEPRQVLKIVAEHGEKVNLAILSWEMRGAESLTYLRRFHPQVTVIVVSMRFELARAAEAQKLGASDILSKPFGRGRLRSAVQCALAGPDASPLVEELQTRMIGRSQVWGEMLARIARSIGLDRETILLTGENGVGKELVAQAIAELGATQGRPMVAVNVAAIPSNLMESTLFGHEAGAFTDARQRHLGLFEQCEDGVLFLDEIGELPRDLQPKLLRVLEQRRFHRVRGGAEIEFRGRLICATNRNLEEEVRAGNFRKDLYHRINGHEVRLPPLRDRRDDLWPLVEHFLSKHGAGRLVRWSDETRRILEEYDFPGNVRELENLIRHCLTECPGTEILPFHLPVSIMQQRREDVMAVESVAGSDRTALQWPSNWLDLPQKEAMKRIERSFNRVYLPRLLEAACHNVTKAAKAADVDQKTFRKKWAESGLPPLSADPE